MIEDAVEDLIGLAMQALNLPDPDGDEQNGSNYGKNFIDNFKLIRVLQLHKKSFRKERITLKKNNDYPIFSHYVFKQNFFLAKTFK